MVGSTWATCSDAMQTEHWISLTGRNTSSKTGGENVYPAEIERVLMTDPNVTDAAVIRVRDDRWGEVPVAFVSRSCDTVTQDTIMAACRASLAAYKLPSRNSLHCL